MAVASRPVCGLVNQTGYSQTKRVQQMTKHLTILVAFLMTVSTQASTQDMTYSDLKNLKVNVLLLIELRMLAGPT